LLFCLVPVGGLRRFQPTTVDKLTIKDATDDVVTDYKTNGRKSLRDVTAKTALHLLPFFGEKRRMNRITTAALRAFIAERQEAGAKAAEINRELAILRRAFNRVLQAGRLLTKPYFPMLKERNTRTGFLEQEQIDRICKALEATEAADDGPKTAGELANVVRFAFATGWRTASEVLPLEWRHVDWQGRTVRLDPGTTKNGEGRSFPFTAAIEKVLNDQLVIHETLKSAGTICPYVFHRDGARISYFRAAWTNACKIAGCPGALVHDMRARPSARSSARACHAPSRCRSSATRPSPSIEATRSWMRPCSARQRPVSMPGSRRYRRSLKARSRRSRRTQRRGCKGLSNLRRFSRGGRSDNDLCF
jgi:integrase